MHFSLTEPLIFSVVLRQNKAVWHAGQAPAGPDLPALRAAVEGPHLHPGAAHLPGAALGHQGLHGRRCVSYDGNDLKDRYGFMIVNGLLSHYRVQL